MLLPAKYKWLASIGPLPKMVGLAVNLLGVQEIPGFRSNPIIMPGMSDVVGVSNIYKNDDTSWCALFMSYLCIMAGKPLPSDNGDIYNKLRAKWFLNFGNKVAAGDERLGDIGIINREGGGHVFLLLAQTDNTYVGIGGNQSNAITIAEFAKARLLGFRRFYAVAMPESCKQYKVSSTGILSINEA